ncbi:MAG UNVERIFIED_CONTAM: hypothetical protein LVT10_21425 [Anaerolineae bacterium]
MTTLTSDGGYGNEALFGDALRIEPSLRHQMQLVTKGGFNSCTPTAPILW